MTEPTDSSHMIGKELNKLVSRSGDRIWSWRGHLLQSRFDPRKEAQVFLDKKMDPETNLVLFIGLEGYYHLKTLLSMDLVKLCCIETDIQLRNALAGEAEYQELFQNRKFVLVEPKGLSGVLENHRGAKTQLLTLPSWTRKHPKELEGISSLYKTRKNLEEINNRTLKKFFPIWVRNLICNCQGSIQGLHGLKNLFKGGRLLVLGAGPSLDEIQLPELEKNYHAIIAVDTASRAVQESGIQVDFWISGDAQYWNHRHMDNLAEPKIGVILDILAPSASARFFPEKTYFVTTGNPFTGFLSPSIGSLRSGGSVSTMAWDFASYLGAKEIHLVGVDLGFPRGRTHARAALSQKLLLAESGRFLPVDLRNWLSLHSPGNFNARDYKGNTIISDQRMEVYLQWFEFALSQPNAPETKLLSTISRSTTGMSPVEDPGVLFPLSDKKTRVLENTTRDQRLDQKVFSTLEELRDTLLALNEGDRVKIPWEEQNSLEVRKICELILPSIFAGWAKTLKQCQISNDLKQEIGFFLFGLEKALRR